MNGCTIVNCDCEHFDQDKLYGKKRRVDKLATVLL